MVRESGVGSGDYGKGPVTGEQAYVIAYSVESGQNAVAGVSLYVCGVNVGGNPSSSYAVQDFAGFFGEYSPRSPLVQMVGDGSLRSVTPSDMPVVSQPSEMSRLVMGSFQAFSEYLNP